MKREGTVLTEVFTSAALKGNPLRDPHVRRIPVYLPPSYPDRGPYPVVYLLAGFTGFGESHLNRNAWTETIAERMDRLIAGGMREAILVMPDPFTAYGGSQWINSEATGRYEDHVVRELVPHVDRTYHTRVHPGARALVGKSSGGYGAIVLGMRHADVFGLVACHSGDMLFEYCYLPDFPKALNTIRKHGGSARRFLEAWRRMPKRGDSSLFPAINTIAMASCYSPNRRAPAGFDLPFDETTGEMREAVWRRWLRHDPVRMLPAHARRLRRLRLLYLDCGTRDEFALHWGMRVFAGRSRKLGLKPVVEEFDDGHMNIQYRYDRSLPLVMRHMVR